MLSNNPRWLLPLVLNLSTVTAIAACGDANVNETPDAATTHDSADAGTAADSGSASASAGDGGSGGSMTTGGAGSPAAGAGGSGAGTGGASASAGTGGASASAGTGGAAATDAGTSSELSTAERDSLLFTREEEKLARDVYTKLQSSDPVFANIASSEQTHMDAVGTLLTRYALPDPAEGKAAGVFENATLQDLYDRLVQEGSASTVDAIKVGVEIEELDIRDITEADADVTHADITRVYEQLTRGSRNHLRAFYKKLGALGGSYTPKYLEPSVFEEIATSAVEKGP